MTLEQRAREIIAAMGERSEVDVFLAGHAEALRWRDPVKEPPPTNILVSVCVCDPDFGHDFVSTDVFNPEWEGQWEGFGAEVSHWRPIGPLPSTEEGEK